MSNNNAEQIEKLQNRILWLAAKGKRPPSDAIKTAFRAVPRHAFVKQFKSGEETVTVTLDNLAQRLPAIYNDGALSLWTDKLRGIESTMSQPTLVLTMLTLLDLKEGQSVFELGAGSGWNAAMIGQIVGPEGRVVSVEIIPEMAAAARQAIAECGIRNVEIISGDGGDGYAAVAPYDRAVFTAGSYDLPTVFHEQIRFGGLLLIVIKVEGGGDFLFLLEKKANCYESRFGSPCRFVPVTGKHAFTAGRPLDLDTLPNWTELSRQEVDRRAFWWGAGGEAPLPGASGIWSFLSVVEPLFRIFQDDMRVADQPRHLFGGLFDQDAKSLTLARNGMLITYGNLTARDRLLRRLHEWIDLGMPSVPALRLRVFPAASEIQSEKNQWIVRRSESVFVWSLRELGEFVGGPQLLS